MRVIKSDTDDAALTVHDDGDGVIFTARAVYEGKPAEEGWWLGWSEARQLRDILTFELAHHDDDLEADGQRPIDTVTLPPIDTDE